MFPRIDGAASLPVHGREQWQQGRLEHSTAHPLQWPDFRACSFFFSSIHRARHHTRDWGNTKHLKPNATPYTPHRTPYITLHPTSHTLHPHPTPYIMLHPTSHTLHPHPTPYTHTLHLTPDTLHPPHYTLQPPHSPREGQAQHQDSILYSKKKITDV